MPPRSQYSAEEIARAALEFVDTHGLEALTLRAIGQMLGMHHTALYRYYPSRGALVEAMVDLMLQDTVEKSSDDTHDVAADLRRLGTNLRASLRQHPSLLLGLVTVSQPTQNMLRISDRAASLLLRASLHGDDIVRWQSVFEAYVVGGALFDFAGAPHHLVARQARYRLIPHEEFSKVAHDLEGLDTMTETAFLLGLDGLINQVMSHGNWDTP